MISNIAEYWRAELLNPSNTIQKERIIGLRGAGTIAHDTVLEQLRDWVVSRSPGQMLVPAEIDARAKAECGGKAIDDYGIWVYFPWARRLVHVLPAEKYRQLRSDRNRDKITADEQHRLSRARIGIVGLSVGAASAVTLALEGVGGHFRLADFDTLALSNLNRLRAGCHELGINKAVLAARHMAEIDPYLTIEIFPDGVRAASIGKFLGTGRRKLDLLIEECDDFEMKLSLREAARARGIPVIMDTNDRGMIDIERFDREPDRPLLHGLLGETRARDLRAMTPDDRVKQILKFVDPARMSPRLVTSMSEIGKSLSTWPQLASDVALGGALLTDVARRILLDQPTASGRYYVDIEALIAPIPP